MIRVCYSMLLLTVLSACANEQAHPALNAQQNAPSSGQNILACTGLPVAGQECGLKLPKMVMAPG